MLENDDLLRSGAGVVGDEVLIAGVARGEHGALAEVYDRYGGCVHYLAARICGSLRADDVVQEVFLRLWRSPRQYDPTRGSLRVFLIALAHAEAIDLHRADRNGRSRDWIDSFRRRRSDGAEFARGSCSGDAVSRVLLALPRSERDAVTLAYFGGFTYREVGWLLEQPDGVVKARIRRGLARLRLQLDGATNAFSTSEYSARRSVDR